MAQLPWTYLLGTVPHGVHGVHRTLLEDNIKLIRRLDCTSWKYTLPKTNQNAPENRPFDAPNGKDRLPSINFQGRLLLVNRGGDLYPNWITFPHDNKLDISKSAKRKKNPTIHWFTKFQTIFWVSHDALTLWFFWTLSCTSWTHHSHRMQLREKNGEKKSAERKKFCWGWGWW